MDSRYQPIRCELHDYLEAACVQSLELEINTEDGSYRGKVLDIKVRSDKTEWLICAIEDRSADSEYVELRLDRLLSIEPLASQRPFGKIRFK